MTVLNPPGWLENVGITHTAAQLRSYLGAMLTGTSGTTTAFKPRGGVHFEMSNALNVTQTVSPSMAVLVEGGLAAIPGSESGAQGTYLIMNDSQITVTVPTAHPTLPRKDIIQCRVRDAFYSGANNDALIDLKQGTAASSPVAPNQDNNSLILAEILVGAGVTSISNANITDKRIFLAGNGGVIRVQSETVSPSTAAIAEGQLWWVNDANRLKIFDGSVHKDLWDSAIQGKNIAPYIQYKHKITTQSKTNDTTASNVDNFTFALEANAVYLLSSWLLNSGPDGANVGDLGLRWTQPAGCRADFGIITPSWTTSSGLLGPANWQAVLNDLASPTSTQLIGVSSGWQSSIMMGRFTTAGSSGTLQMQMFQWTASTTPTNMHSGSWCKLERVA